jgi:uncharacterized protein (DUF1330 family)
MATYLIANIEVRDSTMYEEYRKRVPATIAAHGGRYLARGGSTELLEGEFDVKRFVIVEFPSIAALRTWYDSPEYRPLKEIRERSSRSMMMIVDGA